MDENSSFLIDSSSDDESEIQGEDERGEKRKYEISRSADIYLIDAREAMFSQDCLIDNSSAFIQSLKSIRCVLRKKIWRMDNSLSAIILLGTKTNNQMNLNGINVLQPLKALSAEHILKCDEIIKKVENSSFRKEYGLGDFSLADAFWLCSKTFSENVKNMKLYKTLVLFTNDDDPTNKDKHEFYRIIGIGRDMLQYKIVFNLVNLGKSFNINYLFKELIQLTNGDMDYQIPDPPKTFEEMVSQISNMDYSVYVNKESKLIIQGYYQEDHFRKVKVPFKAKLSKATNAEVITRMEYFETETGEVVKKDNLVKCYRLAGRDIAFTMDDITHIKKFISKGLRLMGFKPASTITLEHYMKPSVFIFPSINDLETCSFFMALHRRCLERQVVPICTFCQRDGAELHYVALIAQAEETDENNRQLCPSGFHVFFLPSAEDVRDLNQECALKNRAGPKEVELAKKIIKKLKFKYKPEKFTNPKLAAHWSAIEALALNLKEPEPFVDSTLPDYDLIRDRTKSVAEEFARLVFPENYDPKTAPKKTSVSCSKQARPEPVVDVEGVERMLRDGQFQRLTNDTLKLYLKKVGKGKDLSKERKAQLIERACKHLQIPPP